MGDIEKTKWCEIMTSKNIGIHLKHPIAYHVDGEPSGEADSFVIKINPCSLNILAPSNATQKP
jgi:diacylglycerol kinase family enzyme